MDVNRIILNTAYPAAYPALWHGTSVQLSRINGKIILYFLNNKINEVCGQPIHSKYEK